MKFSLLSISSLSSEFEIAFREGVCYISRKQIGSKEVSQIVTKQGRFHIANTYLVIRCVGSDIMTSLDS